VTALLQPLGLLGPTGSGLGDTICASRFLPFYPPDVTIAVEPVLARLFSRLAASVIPFAGARKIGPKLYELGGVVYKLWIAGDQDGRSVWRRAHPDGALPPLPALWSDDALRLGEKRCGQMRIGLCWRGSNGDARSISPALLRPLLDVSGVAWVGLQLDDHARELPIPGLDTFGVRDFADTAGILRQLDLVITIDTSIAHLAGSLGAPTWLLNTAYHPGLWEGLTAGPVPWYPTVRLFKQTTPGDWSGVIADVCTALAVSLPMDASSSLTTTLGEPTCGERGSGTIMVPCGRT